MNNKIEKISEIQKDMLAEIFNLGMGQSLRALSELSGKEFEITFDLPHVEIIPREDFFSSLQGNKNSGMILQEYYGELSGQAVMYYPELSGKEIARLLVGPDIPLEKMDQLESDALAEVGNIFINSALSGLGNFIGKEIKTSVPQIVFPEAFGEKISKDNEWIIQLNSSFKIEHLEIDGRIAFIIDNATMKNLLDSIDLYIKKFGG
mgnify:CR=1 FL=1